jgi:hypothetical protein
MKSVAVDLADERSVRGEIYDGLLSSGVTPVIVAEFRGARDSWAAR